MTDTFMGRDVVDGVLDISDMGLDELPVELLSLPFEIITINASNNSISKIENIPIGITCLNLKGNPVKAAPTNIPAGLIVSL